ncbi:MAG: glycosyltransferase [Verrucomicrobiia bacterium]|jgi:glycosyltransferase involved in cell wall biosynthesis
MKFLFVSNLFPNGAEPTRGMHNAQQVAALAKRCEIKVVSPMHQPVPDEAWRGIAVTHPRFVHVPLLSRPLNGWLFARAVEPVIRRERPDIVLVNWAYPDAYGVMLVANKLKLPFATTVQGSDVNVFFQNAARKRQVLRALRASRAVFCRSEALRETLAAEGVAATTVYNGVDHERFRLIDRTETCRKFGLDSKRRRILYVGNLLPVKGPTILASGFQHLLCHSRSGQSSSPGSEGVTTACDEPLCYGKSGNFGDLDVIFLGTGSEAAPLQKAFCMFVATSTTPYWRDDCPTVFLLGARPHDEIPLWMNACDVLCLPSLSEGLPNVALEAMACGLPVVASRVGGVPEVVRDGVNGFLVPPSNPAALADALRRALATKWDREAIRASVSQFDWDVNARTVLDTLSKVLAA